MVHATHKTRFSDSSLYDEICTACGCTDSQKELENPCPKQIIVPTGNWIQTYSGGRFWPCDPKPEHVNIRDIAHALSNQCRFAGHVRKFYSIAQHSVLVSQNVPPEHALWGLLHDAAEAYMCDLPRPIKYEPGMEAFKRAEKRIEAAIVECFGLTPGEPKAVKDADMRLLFTEKRDLLPPLPFETDQTTWGMGLQAEPLPAIIEPWTPERAEREFMMRFWILRLKEFASWRTQRSKSKTKKNLS